MTMGFSTKSMLLLDTSESKLRGEYEKLGSVIDIVAADNPYSRDGRKGKDGQSTGPPRPRQYNETGSPEKLRGVIDTLEPAIRVHPYANIGWMTAELGYNGVMYATGEMTADEALRRSRNSGTETALGATGSRYARYFFKGPVGRSMKFLTGELLGKAGENAYVHMDDDESSNPIVSRRRGFYSFDGPPESISGRTNGSTGSGSGGMYSHLPRQAGSSDPPTSDPIGPPNRPGSRSTIGVEEPRSPENGRPGSEPGAPVQSRPIFTGGEERNSSLGTSGDGSSREQIAIPGSGGHPPPPETGSSPSNPPPATPGTGGHAPAPEAQNRARERRPRDEPSRSAEPSPPRYEPRLDELESALTENVVEETMNRVRGEIAIR